MTDTRKPEDMQKTALEIIARDLPSLPEKERLRLSVMMVNFAEDEVWRAFQSTNVIPVYSGESSRGLVEYDPLPGYSLKDTCKAMAELAGVMGREIKTTFNGAEVAVPPGASFEDIEEIVEDHRAKRKSGPSAAP